jgi:hypothetical protein
MEDNEQTKEDPECSGCIRSSHGAHCAYKGTGKCVNASKKEVITKFNEMDSMSFFQKFGLGEEDKKTEYM